MEAGGAASPAVVFRNRVDELEQVLHYVREGGPPILVMAMPTMGKTRFLQEVPLVVNADPQLGPAWTVSMPIDLTAAGQDARQNLGALLSQFFPGAGWDLTTAERAARIVEDISASGRSRLLLLDGAHLLRPTTARDLRVLLSVVADQLGAGLRLGVVASSRNEIPELQRVAPGPRFEKVLLHTFGREVVSEAVVKELAAQGVADDAENLIEAVWQTSQGLPDLLGRAILWLRVHGGQWRDAEVKAASEALWSAVAVPYLEHLLSIEQLLSPAQLDRVADDRRDAIAGACKTLILGTSMGRLLTRSHVRALSAHDALLQQSIETLRAELGEPLKLLGSLSVAEPQKELWVSLYPAARRLFFRYAFPSEAAQAAAHRLACAVYEGWRQQDLQPPEVSRFALERIYHQGAIALLALEADSMAGFEGYLARLLAEWWAAHPAGAEPLREALAADGELEALLERLRPGLAAQVAQGRLT